VKTIDWIKTYDEADGVSPLFCEQAVTFFECSGAGQKLNQPWQRYRQLTRLDITSIYADVRANIKRVFERYKQDVGCGTLNYVSRLESPSISRYDVDDPHGINHFHSHADSWSMETASRQISVIVYLNDVAAGGETEFDAGLSVSPRAGRVLVFPSSFCYQHRGNAPRSGPKYVLVAWLHFVGEGHVYTTHPL
jgi:prolyl 4-hydroxylase